MQYFLPINLGVVLSWCCTSVYSFIRIGNIFLLGIILCSHTMFICIILQAQIDRNTKNTIMTQCSNRIVELRNEMHVS